jgi:periplasmic divalent cation tolerance protein
MMYLADITTVGSQAEARSMARVMMERRLASCAQILKSESFYT